MGLAHIFSKTAYKALGAVSGYDSWQRYQKLMASQYLPKDKLKEIQTRKLKKLLKHAFYHVPYYRNAWRGAGAAPEDVTSVDDLHKLPTAARTELQSAPENMRTATNFNRNFLQRIQTSGSTTGRPFRLYIDEDAYLEKYALYLRAKTPSGWRLGDRMISMWNRGYPGYAGTFDERHDVAEPYSSIRNIANLLFERKRILPPFERLGTGIHFDTIEGHIEAMRDYKPYVFESFNFIILILAYAIEKYSLRPLEIPVIYSLGELADGQKELVKRTLGREIFDRYGPHEMEGVAYECEAHTGLHISAEGYIVEFLPLAGGDGICELAITDLDNFATPLVRYKIGDLARPIAGKCPCGRTLPLVSHLLGRSADAVRTASGKVLAPVECERLLYGFPEVAFFSLEQRASSDIIINVVPKNRTHSIVAGAIESKVRRAVGESIQIEVHTVDEIPSEKNGKFRFVKSSQ